MKIWIIAGLLMTGCYQKHLILQAEAVSMTKKDAGDVKDLPAGQPVEEKWCIGDQPVLNDGTEDYGMADQVIYKAQGQGKRADFISEVRIWRDTDGCALLEGQLVKM